MSLELRAVVAEKLGFASHQNAVPVLKDLAVASLAGTYESLAVTLRADPPFLEPRTWRIDRLAEGAAIHVADRDVTLSAGLLAGLDEAVTGTLTLEVTRGEELLAASHHPVELLGRLEWGGAAAMPELLAAFVMPNDPAVDRLLKAGSDVLRRAGKRDALDGYGGRSRSRVWELASALWSAVCGLRLSYALPPASFEAQGQKVRPPGAVLDGRVATCLDTALLFAAGLEQMGLNPLLVLTRGHAFVGVWLQPQEFASAVTDEAASLRKRADLSELIVFETTLATQAHPPAFKAAIEAGRRQIAEGEDDRFVMALDVRRARMRRIRPLNAPASAPREGAEAGPAPAAEALEEAPLLPGFDAEVTPEPATPLERVALWQRKLLDLTTRNRLLNLPEGAKAVRLRCPDPAGLEDRLAEGRRIRIVAMPDLAEGGRDADLHHRRSGESLADEYARAALDRGEVLAPLEAKALDAALVDLYRKARADLAEGGANTLYLALGFLKWRRGEADSRVYRAPLVLLPVTLERRSALSGVTLRRHDDEARFNLTLLELLRHDFALTIPSLEGPLPTDASGVDVAGIWTTMRRAVRDVPGFEVVEDLAVGTFSFAKYLVWKDLAERTEQLKASPVVRHLIERAERSFPGGGFPRPERLDDEVDPAELFAPLPADSSQLAAVVASAKGCNFVLDGPPGTGKSQTIANMIAHNLALGRRVLFVAEKMAALDVVHRRLAERGLGELCLELHSAKTSKAEVLKQLERAWDAVGALSAEEWGREAAEVRRLRDRLNRVVRLLHRRHPNGLTLHEAIGRTVRDWNPDLPSLAWPDALAPDEARLRALREIARRLDLNAGAVRDLPEALRAVTRGEWSNGWQERVMASAREVRPALDALAAARDAVLAATRLPLAAGSLEAVDRLHRLAAALLGAAGLDLRFAFAPDAGQKIAAARAAAALVDRFREEEAGLSTPFSREAAGRLDLDRLDAEWAAAGRRIWPLSRLGQRGVERRLAEGGGAAARPDPARDLPALRRMAGLRAGLDAMAGGLAGYPHHAGLGSDVAAMRGAADAAEAIRAAIPAAASDPDALVELRRAVATLVVDANDLLASDGQIAAALAELDRRRRDWADLTERLGALLGADADPARPFETMARLADAVLASAPRLKAWCDWQRARTEAVEGGLGSLVEAVETGAVPEGGTPGLFETLHARWFAARAIDAEPTLRDLVTAEHADCIEAYRRLDERLAALSVRYIRAKVCGLIPAKDEVGRRDGYGVLKHELRKQRAHKPIRQLAAEMGEAFTRLAPCLLMSPLSIAQYLPADQAPFDLVIFDEASQIAPWDAVGSIARGRQVVVAGDPRQMPPTTFFQRAGQASDDEAEPDMESILDECLAAGVPGHGLTWHYRSRHESLIAFANHRYYEGGLITFPAAVTRESAVAWRRVEGVYTKGKARTNQVEAEAIVAEVVRRLTDPTPAEVGHTLAVVTLNAEQQTLIENLLDGERRRRPEIERFFGEEVVEPVVVKNLETVQGDERDVVLLGITYGPTEPGAATMSMNFGPLNRDGGWRRLNVAVTRARREMVVFTSFDPSMIDLNRTGARAVKDLKHFLEFAERGPRALAEAVQGSVGGHESPFEEAVASALKRRGWSVVPQIGVSRFRIDLGVVHPDRPGDYLAGVECDGATYHAAATARDRDRVRAAILEGLGWRLVRVWSTDWWVDKAGALDRLDAALRALLDRSRAERAELAASVPEAAAAAPVSEVGAGGDREEAVVPTRPREAAFARAAERVSGPAPAAYRRADLSSFAERLDPDLFHEPAYDGTLGALVAHVLQAEAPIGADALVARIARAHGFQRSGRLIRDRVMALAEQSHHVAPDPTGASFVWEASGDPEAWRGFRVPADEAEARAIEEIAFEELRAAARAAAGPDPAVEVARLFGVRRLSAPARRRLDLALGEAATRPPGRADFPDAEPPPAPQGAHPEPVSRPSPFPGET